MKNRLYIVFFVIVAIAFANCAFAQQDLYYDVDPSTADIDGGTGNWEDAKWKTTVDGTTGTTWSSGDSAYFDWITSGSLTTTITLAGPQTAGSINFLEPGYTLTGSTLSLGTAGWYNMDADGSVGSTLGNLRVRGSSADYELEISGGGTFATGTEDSRVVLGDTGYLGTVRQTAGDLVVNEYMMIGGNSTANSQGHYIMDAGTLTVANGMYFGWSNADSSGTFTQNGGTVTANGQGLQLTIGGGGTYNLNGGTLNAHIGGDGYNGSPGVINFNGGSFVANGASANNPSITGNIGAGATALIDSTGYNTYINGVISGASANGLTLQGGNLILSSDNTYTGASTVQAGGMLWMGNGNATGAVAGDIVVEAGGTYRDARSGSHELSNNISGAGQLEIMGNGAGNIFTVTGNNTHSGGSVARYATTLKVGSDNALGTGEVTSLYSGSEVDGGGAIDLNGHTVDNDFVVEGNSFYQPGGGVIRNSDTLTEAVINGNVTIGGNNYLGGGGGAFTINGVVSDGVTDGSYGLLMTDGKLTLANPNNTYDGFTHVSGGSTIEVTKLANLNETSSVGQSTVAGANKISFTVDNGGTLRYIGSLASTSDRVMELGGGSNIIEAEGTTTADTLTLTSDMSGAGAVTLGGANAGDNEISGVIGSTSSLTKTGAGKWILSGANTYSGATTVDGGTLAVDGSVASAVTVANGATLSGTGALNGGVTVNSGGTLSPGASPGTMTISGGDLTLDGADLAVDIWGNGGAGNASGHDQISLSVGSLILANSPTISVDLGGSFDPAIGEQFTIVTGGGTGWSVGDWGIVSVDNAPTAWTTAGKDFEVDQGSVMLTVIPEPGTGMLVIAAFGIVYLRRKLRG